VSTFDQYDLVLICNHRVAASLEKIYPNFKYIYCLPDAGQDVQHFMHPLEFADDVCNAVLEKGGSKPTLILSQMSILSTFVSYILLTRYKDRRVSLIDIGKPLQTLFSPDITGGGAWRDGHNLRDHYSKLSHLMSKEMYDRLMRDTNITCESGLKFKQDMDCEYAATYRKPLF